jgi:hypothetical protein
MYKRIKSLASVILVGILTSAFWEILIKDLLFGIGNFFADSMNLLYKGYIDDLYNKVGSGANTFQSIPSIFIFVFAILSPFVFLLFNPILYKRILIDNESNQNIEDKRKSKIEFLFKTRWLRNTIILLLLLFNSIIYTNLLLKITTSEKPFLSIERRLIIIKPSINQHNYDILKSKLFQIDSKQKVILLLHEINVIAKENNIILNEAELIGIGDVTKL